MSRVPRPILCAVLVGLAGCSAVPSQPAAPLPPRPGVAELQAMHAAVVEAGKADARELAVVPLRDPMVEDLRARAAAALQAGDLAGAGDALNEALLIVADDPAVLQERAEVALLGGELERAQTLAGRAIELGSAAGPLCRRHWETLYQVRGFQLRSLVAPAKPELLAGHQAAVAELEARMAQDREQREACTVAGFERL